MGPLTVSLSNSPDADDPGFRVVTFDQVKAAYTQQARALIAGGADLLLVETIFDTLNAKAALVAIREVFDEDGLTASGRELPVMISAAVGRGGETMISAQTIEAFWNAVEHAKPLAVGLNCSLGPDLMSPFLARAGGEGRCGDVVLSECGAAESAFADGVRPGAGGHGAVSERVCARRTREYCRRLLREYAGAHCGNCEGAGGRAAAEAAGSGGHGAGGVEGAA